MGVLSGCLLWVVLLLVFSGVMATGSLSFSLLDTLMIVTLAAGAFFGGYVSARILRENGLLWGLLSGGSMFLLVLLCGVILSGAEFSWLLPVKLSAMLLTGALGGIIGVNQQVKR